MLQQTGARQVEKMLPLFIKQFPNVHTLAKASPADILRAWQGLGYNRRALNLLRAAKTISARGKRPFPNTFEELRELPGVGQYTASAILAFAYNRDVPVVDVNIERVLSRAWKPMKNYSETVNTKLLYDLDAAIMPLGQSSVWHEVLMDFGATLCTKNKPQCIGCPIREDCRSSKRFLKLERVHLLARSTTPELRYFGEPRRIWRGRILKLAADCIIITPRVLLSRLRKQFGVQDEDFASFIEGIIRILTKEGFLVRDAKGKLSLPVGDE